MALDHVRAYMHFDSLQFSPTDLSHTTGPLFLTRFVTHLCAPTFILLSGTSAYFIEKRKTIKETSNFLVTRGLWLIVLQMTLIRFAWNFDPLFHFNSSNIISTIGFCMIILSFLIRFQLKVILTIGLIMIFGHNALDKISFEQGTLLDVVWSFLHVKKIFLIGNEFSFSFLYPIIPWAGVMMLGYCLGSLYDYTYSSEKRKSVMMQIVLSCFILFLSLRFINAYGDPAPWSFQLEAGKTVMSFFNVEKYPPSLMFLLLMLGITFLILSMLEGKTLSRWKPIVVFGNVSLFYYVMHIFAIHVFALIAVVIAGYPWHTMIFIGSSTQPSPLLKGKFGFSLSQIYLIWISIVVFLYPFCTMWNSFKSKNKSKWWVSYV